MKKLLFVVLLFVVSGCLNHAYTVFEGESEHWSATYTVEEPGQDMNRKTLEMRYTGDNPEAIRHVKYEYKAPGGSGSGEMDGLPGGRTLTAGSGGTGMIPSTDSVIEVIIEWDGNKEEMELKVK